MMINYLYIVFMCLYSINVFFGTYLTYIEKKSEGLSRYMFILFFLFSVKRRKHQRQSVLEKILISLKK